MSTGDVVILAERLGKKYLIGHQAEREGYVALRDIVARTSKTLAQSARDILRGRQLVASEKVEEFWALKEVSFEIKRGEVVGIIGRNGAGKSTLLKILSRITEPSAGRVKIRGRVASLLEVGTGFHPELTGRENIYLNGAILGMTRAEIKAKFDEIAAFAEVERFLDTPVKRYSSGMYVRLAFAVAAHLDSEILIVDEVLAVGDAAFQNKCLSRMAGFGKTGRTVLFVSHNLSAVRALCPTSIYLQSGQIESVSKSETVIKSYMSNTRANPNPQTRATRQVQDGLIIEQVDISPSELNTGGQLIIKMRFRADSSGSIRQWVACIFSSGRLLVGVMDANPSVPLPFHFNEGRFIFIVEIAAVPLIDRNYSLALWLVTNKFEGTIFDIAEFTVNPTIPFLSTYSADARGIVALSGQVSLVSGDGS